MTYLDIETVSAFKDFDSADQRTQELFEQKMRIEPSLQSASRGKTINVFADPPKEYKSAYEIALYQLYQEKAALFAEFNRIVCISVGSVTEQDFVTEQDHSQGKKFSPSINIQSFYQLEELALLRAFINFLMDGRINELCAHYGKGFDYRVLSQKFIIHGLDLPYLFDNRGKKPWEINLRDTAELWKFGDMKHTASLDLLAHCFGLPSPKKDMHGADVGRVYWNEGIEGLKKIVAYCEDDVRALINVDRRISGKTMIL